MVKVVTGICLALGLMVSEARSDNFFVSELKGWTVYGNEGTDTINPGCNMRQTYEDGSFFNIVKDLTDGELYFVIKNMAWNFKLKPGSAQKFGLLIRAGEQELLTLPEAMFIVIDKNTLALPDLPEEFIRAVAVEGSLIVLMPKDVQSPDLPLDGAVAALKAMVECITKSRGIVLSPTKGTKVISHETYNDFSRDNDSWGM